LEASGDSADEDRYFELEEQSFLSNGTPFSDGNACLFCYSLYVLYYVAILSSEMMITLFYHFTTVFEIQCPNLWSFASYLYFRAKCSVLDMSVLFHIWTGLPKLQAF
jgi:hypothetical protein